MPQTNNIITPKERLLIAAQIGAALMVRTPQYGHTEVAINALDYTDTIIAASGCIVEGADVATTHEMD